VALSSPAFIFDGNIVKQFRKVIDLGNLFGLNARNIYGSSV
jgi:hypothetical protein